MLNSTVVGMGVNFNLKLNGNGSLFTALHIQFANWLTALPGEEGEVGGWITSVNKIKTRNYMSGIVVHGLQTILC